MTQAEETWAAAFEAFYEEWQARLGDQLGDFRDALAALCWTAIDCAAGDFAEKMGVL